MKLRIIEINQNLKPADLNHWKETINFHISYADFATKELTDLFYLLYLLQWLLINTDQYNIAQLTDQHSKNQKPKKIWKLFLLPPWKEFQQKNWKFQKEKQKL